MQVFRKAIESVKQVEEYNREWTVTSQKVFGNALCKKQQKGPSWTKHLSRLQPQLEEEGESATSPIGTDKMCLKLNLRGLDAVKETNWKVIDDPGQQLETVEAPNPERTPRLAEPLRRVLQENGVVRVEELDNYCDEIIDAATSNESEDSLLLERILSEAEGIFKYIPASKDHKLQRLARDLNLRYTGSTSSVVPVLSNIYHVLSRYRRACIDGLSGDFRNSANSFTRYMLKPATVTLYPNSDGIYNIDKAEEKPPKVGVLSDVGHLLERLFTQENLIIKKRLDFSSICSSALEENEPQVKSSIESIPVEYRFSKFGSCLFRAQVDCYDPATGEFFDVKTRALAAIRYQIERYEDFLEKEITKTNGFENSFERELYDMIRSVFIKYALQFRIGGMSGAFVSFHSINKVSGYQYIPLGEIEKYVFGNEAWASKSFGSSMKIFEEILNQVITSFPGSDPIRITFDPFSHSGVLDIYAVRLRDNIDLLDWRQLQEREFNKQVKQVFPILPEDCRKFQVPIAAFVNTVYSGAPIDYKENDRLHLLYAIQQSSFSPDEYEKVLKLSLGLEDMPPLRYLSVVGLSSVELADLLAADSFDAFYLDYQTK
eukprot:jgi/Galph1/908/GphlegSOOS_G5619.1